jgi:hypothetical protein
MHGVGALIHQQKCCLALSMPRRDAKGRYTRGIRFGNACSGLDKNTGGIEVALLCCNGQMRFPILVHRIVDN